MSWKKERRRKIAESFEGRQDYDRAIRAWEAIEDFEEAARVRGLKAEYSAASAGQPPSRDKQAMRLTLLSMIFLGLTVVLFFAKAWLGTLIPCCSSSILFIICAMWLSKITDEDKAVKNSVIVKIKEQRKAVEEEKLREEHARQGARQRAQRRKAMRQEANERERALDYNSAIRIWEELGQIKEAARVRKLKARQSAIKVDQTVVHGDYVDDRDTIVKDSVVSKSSIGASGDGDDLAAKLQQLAQMHRDGILSDEQFEAAKNKLLN